MYTETLLVLIGLAGFTFGVDCPSNGQYFFPHPTRCAKFIECNHGLKVVQECFGDLIFNPDVGFCDFRENFECEDVEEPDLPEEGPVGTCPPINGQYVDFLTDARFCGIFYMCNWGTAIRMECPNGLHFNPAVNVCDWPIDVGCTLED